MPSAVLEAMPEELAMEPQMNVGNSLGLLMDSRAKEMAEPRLKGSAGSAMFTKVVELPSSKSTLIPALEVHHGLVSIFVAPVAINP